jgi:phospholipase/lecithinase/hemolysin
MQTHYRQAVRVTSGLLGILAMIAAAPTRPQAQAGASAIVAFGDSLTDTGNAFAVTGEPGVPPDFGLDPFLLPSTAYARGGHHLSNGATWIEQLARPLGLVGSVQPALRSQSPFALNFAVATARARTTLTNPGFDLLVATFLQKTGNVAPSDALYVIELGGHDVRDALAVSLGGGDPVPVLQAAVDAIGDNIRTLYAAGARNFLVWTVPDIGLIPAVRAIPGASPVATLYTGVFNGMLGLELAAVAAELPGIDIIPFDASGLITNIVAQPAQFGLTDVTHACVTPNTPPFFCQNPDEFLFWDGIHPTKAGHAIIAQAVAQLLGID